MSDTERGSAREALMELQRCAEGWEPDARLVGNVRAGDIAAACALALRALAPTPEGSARETLRELADSMKARGEVTGNGELEEYGYRLAAVLTPAPETRMETIREQIAEQWIVEMERKMGITPETFPGAVSVPGGMRGPKPEGEALERLRWHLLTPDGRGKSFKGEVLDQLLDAARAEGRREGMGEYEHLYRTVEAYAPAVGVARMALRNGDAAKAMEWLDRAVEKVDKLNADALQEIWDRRAADTDRREEP